MATHLRLIETYRIDTTSPDDYHRTIALYKNQYRFDRYEVVVIPLSHSSDIIQIWKKTL